LTGHNGRRNVGGGPLGSRGARVTLHASVAEMLEAAAIDGVLVVAPTDQHGAVIAEVAARGLPILCEKPCGLTAAARVGPDGRRRGQRPAALRVRGTRHDGGREGRGAAVVRLHRGG